MRRRFRDRVWLERTVLRSVNSRKLHERPLVGLSRQAIEHWRAENGISTESQLVDRIVEISRSGELLIDSSRDVFLDDQDNEITESLRIQLQGLESELQGMARLPLGDVGTADV